MTENLQFITTPPRTTRRHLSPPLPQPDSPMRAQQQMRQYRIHINFFITFPIRGLCYKVKSLLACLTRIDFSDHHISAIRLCAFRNVKTILRERSGYDVDDCLITFSSFLYNEYGHCLLVPGRESLTISLLRY